MKDLLSRAAYAVRAWLLDKSFDPVAGRVASGGVFLMSWAVRGFLPGASLTLLSWAHCEMMRSGQSRSPADGLNGMIEGAIRRACAPGGLVEHLTAGQTGGQMMDRLAMVAGIVLKAPRCEAGHVVEKGVLLLKNNERIDSFRRSVDIDNALRNYTLVLEPSWSGYAILKLLAFTNFRNHPILVMSPYPADYEFLQRLGSNLLPIAIGCCDWADPQVFRPIPGEAKQYDAVIVSRWTVTKRLHVLFRAIRQINDPSYRVAIIAPNSPTATDRQVILSMIDRQGLGKQITVMEDLDPTEVNTVVNQSKVNLLLSRQEGGNRSLFEGFFAGVPGLALRDHVGIPKQYFTPETGRMIREDELAQALLEFREHWQDFSPRPWALRNIAPEVTAARLNLVLKGLARQREEAWTRDIVAKCNRPDMHYYPDESAGEGLPSADGTVAIFPASTP